MDLLLWVSLITGGLLVILLILSLIGGMDLDLDTDINVDDVDTGGLGMFKSILTFVSICTYVIRLVLATSANPILAFAIGIVAGLFTVFLLSLMVKFLLSQESNVNWHIEDTLFLEAKVYLKIPSEGEGIIHVVVNGVNREIKAKTTDLLDIETGAIVTIEATEDSYVIVTTK